MKSSAMMVPLTAVSLHEREAIRRGILTYVETVLHDFVLFPEIGALCLVLAEEYHEIALHAERYVGFEALVLKSVLCRVEEIDDIP